MNSLLSTVASDLIKRESAQIVAATGLLFLRLTDMCQSQPIEGVVTCRGGVWGQEAQEGMGFPVLRSTNMRGKYVDVRQPAWCDISPSKIESNSVETGDILVTKSSGSSDLVGKAALFIHPEDRNTYLFSNFTLRLRPNKSIILPEYLAWFLRSPQALSWRYDSQQNAVGLRNLQTKGFLSQKIPIPERDIQQTIVSYLNSLETGTIKMELPIQFIKQQRIVVRIEELATRIEEAHGLRREVAEETKSLLNSAITTLTNDLQIDGVLSQVLKNPPRNGWSPQCDNLDNGTAVLSLSAVTDFDYRENQYKTTSMQTNPEGHYWLKEGDLLITRSNTPDLVGHVAVYNGKPTPCIYPDLIMRLQVNEEIADKWFVYWWMRGNLARKYIKQNAKGTSPTMRKISQGTVMGTPFPVSTSLEVQQKIVVTLNNLQKQMSYLSQNQAAINAEINAILPSLLDRAFRGEM